MEPSRYLADTNTWIKPWLLPVTSNNPLHGQDPTAQPLTPPPHVVYSVRVIVTCSGEDDVVAHALVLVLRL